MTTTETDITTIVPSITVADFRRNIPAFEDSSIYQDEVITIWLQVATGLLNARRWGSLLPMGISWFVAHQLALDRQAQIVALRGGVAGSGFGIVTSKSINGVSVSYNNALSGLKDAGDWNLTIYGVRFLGFARMFGSGGMQIIGDDAQLVAEGNLVTGFNGTFPNF